MSDASAQVGDVVTATAPVRIADVGGWSDTWFAESGAVCHLGVGPGVRVQARVDPPAGEALPVRIIAPDLGEDYRCGPDPDLGWTDPIPCRHRLLEYAVASVCKGVALPGPLTVTIESAVPPGASLGTSAAVVVAVLAALEVLLTPSGDEAEVLLSDSTRKRLAGDAHRVETGAVQRESGVQDQLAAAFGGAQLITIPHYPATVRDPIRLEPSVAAALDATTATVVLGPHDSSSVHTEVIEALRTTGPSSTARLAALEEIRGLALTAATALEAGDLAGWAQALSGATESQQRLHPGLVGPGHHAVIDLAKAGHASGWKVNGAGGDGGSVTVVFPDRDARDRFVTTVASTMPSFSVHLLTIAPGVTVHRER